MSFPSDPVLEELMAHAPWARTLARRLLADPGDGEDCVQDTWIAALRHPPASDASLRIWIQRVLRNFALQRRRSEDRRRRREMGFARTETGPSPDELVQRMEVQRMLAEEVLALDEPYRGTIVLHFYEGRSSAQIARQLGVPSATIRSRLRRGLQLLRARLSERSEEGDSWPALLGAFVMVPERIVRRTGESSLVGAPHALGALLVVLGGAILATRWTTRSQPGIAVATADLAGRAPHAFADSSEGIATEIGERRVLGTVPAASTFEAASGREGWWLRASVRSTGDVPLADARVLVSPTRVLDDAPFAAFTDAEGLVEIDISALFLAPEGMPLRLFVSADAPAFLSAEIVLPLTHAQRQDGFHPGGSVRLTAPFELAPARARVEGRLVPGSAGERVVALFPLPVERTPASEHDPLSWWEVVRAAPLDLARVSPDGEFSLRAPHAGTHLLVAAAHASANEDVPAIVRPIELTEERTSIRLAWPAGQEIEGRVILADGRAGERCLVAAHPQSTWPDWAGEDLAWNGQRFERITRLARTDEEGRFRFRGLAPLTYELRLESGSFDDDRGTPTLWLGGRPTEPSVSVVAPARGVELRIPDRTARFVEIWRDGAPVPAARVGEDPSAASDASGRVCLFFDPSSAPVVEIRALPSAPVPLQLQPSAVSMELPLRVNLPDLGPRASLAIELSEDPERELEAAVLELFELGVDARRAVGPRDSVWRGRARRMREGLTFRDLPAGHWQARLVPTGPGPDAGEERSFCEEVFDLDLAPGEDARKGIAFRRGGWLRILPHALGESSGEHGWRLRRAAGEIVPMRLVQRVRLATLPVAGISFAHELETPAALPAGEYLLEVFAEDGPLLARSFRIEVGRTTTLAPDPGR